MSVSNGATVLVTGATGAVGPCVVQALCEAGHTVRTFSLDRPHSRRQLALRSLGEAGTTDPLRDSPGRSALAELGAATAGQAPDQASPKGYAPARDGPGFAQGLCPGTRRTGKEGRRQGSSSPVDLAAVADAK